MEADIVIIFITPSYVIKADRQDDGYGNQNNKKSGVEIETTYILKRKHKRKKSIITVLLDGNNMPKYIEELVRLEKWISKENCAIWSSKLVYGHEVNIGEDGEYQKAIFQSDTLEEYIINLLSHRVHKLQYTEIEEDEILSYPELYLAQKMYNIQIKNESDVKCQLDEIDTAISNLERYKTVMENAKKSLDLNSSYEHLVYERLEKLCKVYFMTPYV